MDKKQKDKLEKLLFDLDIAISDHSTASQFLVATITEIKKLLKEC
jgi:hypothetical protein